MCDVTSPESGAAAVAAAVERHGALHVLANIAGVGCFKATEALTLAEWNNTLAVNLTGTFLMCQAALEPLIATRGTIVNMASVAGLRATPYNAAYCASKGGVVMLTKALAVEFGRRGLRVNCVCPTAVDTPFLDNFEWPEDGDLGLFARTAAIIERRVEPAEVAGGRGVPRVGRRGDDHGRRLPRGRGRARLSRGKCAGSARSWRSGCAFARISRHTRCMASTQSSSWACY